jgi:hypothetical protein
MTEAGAGLSRRVGSSGGSGRNLKVSLSLSERMEVSYKTQWYLSAFFIFFNGFINLWGSHGNFRHSLTRSHKAIVRK